jgi:hypothetical protein
VKEIWSMLGLILLFISDLIEHLDVEESSRIYFYSGITKLGANSLINPCRIPGIHPHL